MGSIMVQAKNGQVRSIEVKRGDTVICSEGERKTGVELVFVNSLRIRELHSTREGIYALLVQPGFFVGAGEEFLSKVTVTRLSFIRSIKRKADNETEELAKSVEDRYIREKQEQLHEEIEIFKQKQMREKRARTSAKQVPTTASEAISRQKELIDTLERQVQEKERLLKQAQAQIDELKESNAELQVSSLLNKERYENAQEKFESAEKERKKFLGKLISNMDDTE